MEEMVTPVLTHHARQRCQEMGISTKVAKRIYQHHTIEIPGNQPGTAVRRSDLYPAYRVVCRPDEHKILTVDFYSLEPYHREGSTFTIRK